MKKALAILQSQIDYLQRKGELNHNDGYQLQLLIEIKEALNKNSVSPPTEKVNVPSEEEIFNKVMHVHNVTKGKGFIEGAKWMRDLWLSSIKVEQKGKREG